MPSPIFTNDYAPDGKAIREAARVAAGHRCIRCGHPYECGIKRGDGGEWSACDEQCTHPATHRSPIRMRVKGAILWDICIANPVSLGMDIPSLLRAGLEVEAQWRVLTVHHFDGDKANDLWWNHLALCQKCHLSFQTRVNPEIPWLFEHSPWLKPFVAGFYAKKYLGLDLVREQVMVRLEELLALECRVS